MPNNTNHDNFSTRDNSNPFTGTTGTRARDYSSDAYNYGAGQQIVTGSRGGQYYVNGNGKKCMCQNVSQQFFTLVKYYCKNVANSKIMFIFAK
jgi:hypothetical protein